MYCQTLGQGCRISPAGEGGQGGARALRRRAALRTGEGVGKWARASARRGGMYGTQAAMPKSPYPHGRGRKGLLYRTTLHPKKQILIYHLCSSCRLASSQHFGLRQPEVLRLAIVWGVQPKVHVAGGGQRRRVREVHASAPQGPQACLRSCARSWTSSTTSSGNRSSLESCPGPGHWLVW